MGTSGSRLTKLFPYKNEDMDNASYTGAEFSLPDDLLIDVLSFVPASDLLKNCSLVCLHWRDIINSHGVWKIKCKRYGKIIPPVNLPKLPDCYYKIIYFFNPYGRNLMQNPCGIDNLNEWGIMDNYGDGFAVEFPPKGAEPVPTEVGAQHCFATSYGKCKKCQCISLEKEGMIAEIIDSGKAVINIQDWYAARFDCASVYKLKISLMDTDFQAFDSFEFEHTEEQWTGKTWSKVAHTFDSIVGTRYVFFEHEGQDSQYWAGHYGSKMTGSSITIGFKQ